MNQRHPQSRHTAHGGSEKPTFVCEKYMCVCVWCDVRSSSTTSGSSVSSLVLFFGERAPAGGAGGGGGLSWVRVRARRPPQG